MDLSTMATNRWKDGRTLTTSLTISTAKATAGLDDFFAPVIGPEETLDLSMPLVLCERKLRWNRQQVEARDLEHRQQVEELSRLLTRRDKLTRSVAETLINTRRVCLGLYGDDELVALGLDGTVARDATNVLRQGRKAWLRLSQRGGMESPDWVDVEIDLGSLAQSLRRDTDVLDRLLDEIGEKRRLVEATASAKRAALRDFDLSYLLIARSAEAAYRMAGMDDEAERARPPRRRGSSGSDGGPEGSDAAAVSDDAEPDDAEPDVTSPDGTSPDGATIHPVDAVAGEPAPGP